MLVLVVLRWLALALAIVAFLSGTLLFPLQYRKERERLERWYERAGQPVPAGQPNAALLRISAVIVSGGAFWFWWYMGRVAALHPMPSRPGVTLAGRPISACAVGLFLVAVVYGGVRLWIHQRLLPIMLAPAHRLSDESRASASEMRLLRWQQRLQRYETAVWIGLIVLAAVLCR